MAKREKTIIDRKLAKSLQTSPVEEEFEEQPNETDQDKAESESKQKAVTLPIEKKEHIYK